MKKRLVGMQFLAVMFLMSVTTSIVYAYTTENVIVVLMDGIRYSETFADSLSVGSGNTKCAYSLPSGVSFVPHQYIPHIWNDLRPQGSIGKEFYNDGTTITKNGVSYIETGALATLNETQTPWLSIPTFYEYYRKGKNLPQPTYPDVVFTVGGKTYDLNLSYSTASGYGIDYQGTSDYGMYTNCASFTPDNAIHDFTGVPPCAPPGDWDGSSSADVEWTELQWLMDNKQPKFIYFHMYDTDSFAHLRVWDNPSTPEVDSYVEAIRNQDTIVYNLWQKIQSSPFYAGKTTLIITNDHGRNKSGNCSGACWADHDTGDCGCKRVMFLAIGPDFKANFSTSTKRYLKDICPTTGELLCFPTPSTYVTGSEMSELFKSYDACGGK